MASSGLIRLRTFSRRSGSMATRSRTSLLRVLHFAYLLQPIPIARSAEMIQTVISVDVTRRIKKRKALRTTQCPQMTWPAYIAVDASLCQARRQACIARVSRAFHREVATVRGRLAVATASCDHEEC